MGSGEPEGGDVEQHSFLGRGGGAVERRIGELQRDCAGRGTASEDLSGVVGLPWVCERVCGARE
jgi:hypothetical protein